MKTATLAKVANSEQELVAKGHAVIRTLKTGWLELCSIMLELQNLNPTWTQERLGQEFGLSQQSVSSGLVTIQDERIYLRVSKNPDSLPTSRFLQYQLTTIKGPDFDRYCRPDVTREEIAEYKRRLTAPISDTRNEHKPADRPKCPGVEGIGPGLWKWSEGTEEWIQQPKYEEPVKRPQHFTPAEKQKFVVYESIFHITEAVRPFITSTKGELTRQLSHPDSELSIMSALNLFGILPLTNWSFVEAGCKTLIHRAHPDKGGDAKVYDLYVKAFDVLKQHPKLFKE